MLLKPASLALIAVAVLFGAGCSGINTSHSVSPATFLLPGFFGQTPPAPADPLPAGESVQTIAQAN